MNAPWPASEKARHVEPRIETLNTESAQAPKVSVCIFTYNQQRYIEQAVESVLSQETDFTYELVISDDCSTDRTRRILEQYRDKNPEKIRLLLREQNIGGRRCFIEAYQTLRGQYITRLDGDDFWTSPHKLRKQVDALDAHDEWAICFHLARIFHDDGQIEPFIFPRGFSRRVSRLEDLLTSNFMPTCTVMYRSGLIDPYLQWFAKVPRPGDWCLYILLARHGEIGFLDEVMAEYRLHAENQWSDISCEERNYYQSMKMLRTVSDILEPRHRRRIYRTIYYGKVKRLVARILGDRINRKLIYVREHIRRIGHAFGRHQA